MITTGSITTIIADEDFTEPFSESLSAFTKFSQAFITCVILSSDNVFH
jgi:hypothetical protein